jgi:phosphonate transport system substrate-binding protein
MRQDLMCLLFLLCTCAKASELPPLEIGIWPYMSTQALLTLYPPLQKHLEASLHRPVLFVTAPNERAFVDRTRNGAYPFVITAPHFARLAQEKAGYVPMLRPERNLVCLLLVEKNGPVHRLEDLKNKTVTLPSKITIVTMLTLKALEAKGLQPGRDFTLRYASSHNSAVLDVLRGESAASATAATILDQMPASDKSALRVLAKTGEVPPLFILANPSMPKEDVAQMKRMLLDFVQHTPEGKRFLKRVAWHGLVEPSNEDMRSLDPYVNELNALLGSAK